MSLPLERVRVGLGPFGVTCHAGPAPAVRQLLIVDDAAHESAGARAGGKEENHR